MKALNTTKDQKLAPVASGRTQRCFSRSNRQRSLNVVLVDVHPNACHKQWHLCIILIHRKKLTKLKINWQKIQQCL